MPVILVSGAAPPQWLVETAERLGLGMCTLQSLETRSADVVAYVMNSFDGHEPIRADHHLLRRLPGLQVVIYQGQSLEPGDYEEFADLDVLRTRGIRFTTTPAGDPVAEAALGLLIALDLDLIPLAVDPDATPVQRRGLSGHTLGIVGMGQIGRRVAHLARAAGMDLAYSSRSRHPHMEERVGATPLPLAALFSNCTFVSIHLPLCTRPGLIDRSVLRAGEGVILVNTTSAPRLVDPGGLHEALVHGSVHRAAIEGRYHHPWQDRLTSLGKHRYVSLPAYASWDTPAARDSSWQQSLDAARAALAGRPLQHGLT